MFKKIAFLCCVLLIFSMASSTFAAFPFGLPNFGSSKAFENVPPSPILDNVCARVGGVFGRFSIAVPPFCAKPPILQPSVDLSTNPTTVSVGATSTLSWISTHAETCTASGGWSGNKPLNGSEVVTVSTTTTYTLTCVKNSQSVSDTVIITTIPVTIPMPSATLSANPSSVVAGATSTLSWISSNASTCMANGGWTGVRALSGSEVVTVATTTTYILACSNASGTATSSAIVSATTAPLPTPTINLEVNPTELVESGTTTLSWTSTNALSCTASNGWTGIKAISGNEPIFVSTTTTFTLTCENGNASTTDSAIVTVSKPIPAPTVDLEASPTTVVLGATSTLSWTSTNANSCTASSGWSGSKGTSSSEIVSPGTTTTYLLECSGAGGLVGDDVTITVTGTTTPSLSHIIISEVYYDVDAAHGSETANEWIELYNPTSSVIDLTGWRIGDAAASTTGDILPLGTLISGNGFLLITSSTTTASFWNISTTTPIVVLTGAIGSNGLANAGDAVFLTNLSSTTVDAISYGTNMSVFSSPIPGVGEGHSIERNSLLEDTDTAADWMDMATPTPGQ